MKKSLFTLILLIDILLNNKIKAQSFLNGSFEDNIADSCYIINISNSTFDSIMNHVRGIGGLEALDILRDSCWSIPNAENGRYYISLENYINTVPTTAISLELSDTITLGSTFAFSFHYQKATVFPTSPIEIGISNDSTTFGNLVFAVPAPDSTIWVKRIVSFIAPITGKYITARAGYNLTQTWMLIDNFSLDTSTVSVYESQSKKERGKLFPNPNNGKMEYEYSLQKNSVGHFEIHDVEGRKIALYKLDDDRNILDINLENIPGGIYLYKVIVDGFVTSSNRIVIIK